jgi:carboxyl-terminal processing protease
MKKLILSILLLVCCCNLHAQAPTYTDKLFYTCKLYGFVKYYHSEVSTCKVNWDSVLIDRLPAIKAANTKNDFNDVLMEMLSAAGPMTPAAIPLPDTLPARLKRNRDWGWTNDAVLRNDVSAVLNNIKTNFVPHDICWVKENPRTDPNVIGFLLFPADTNYVENITTVFPTEEKKLLMYFKYWNILNYFNPYKYVLDTPWDNTFYNTISLFTSANTVQDLHIAFAKLNSRLNDAHVEISNNNYVSIFADKGTTLKMRYASGKYIAINNVTPIRRGDEIIDVNGISTSQMEDSLRMYISAGNDVVFRRFARSYMLSGSTSTANISYRDNSGNIQNTIIGRSGYPLVYDSFYPTDSLKTTRVKYFSCGIVYINPSNTSVKQIESIYNAAKDNPYLIIDMRHTIDYDVVTALTNMLYSQNTIAAKSFKPNTKYPGTYYNGYSDIGVINNTPYTGKVILLTYEDNQSSGENTIMHMQQLPNVITIGTQTAGTDGNITYIPNIIRGVNFVYTSLGWYYPNGDSTQRIGVGPRKPGDVLVQLTQQGIRAGRDEILEAALKAAGCPLSTEEVIQVMNEDVIYPNPTTNTFSIKAGDNNSSTIKIYSLTGQLILETKETQNINIATLSAGTYLVQVADGNNLSTTRLIKE